MREAGLLRREVRREKRRRGERKQVAVGAAPEGGMNWVSHPRPRTPPPKRRASQAVCFLRHPAHHVTEIIRPHPAGPIMGGARQAPEFFERFQEEAVGNAVSWGMFRRFRGFRLELPEDTEALKKAEALRQRLEAALRLFDKLDALKTGLVRGACGRPASSPQRTACCCGGDAPPPAAGRKSSPPALSAGGLSATPLRIPLSLCASQLRPCDLTSGAAGVTLTPEEQGLLVEMRQHFSEIDVDKSTSLSLAEVHYYITKDKARDESGPRRWLCIADCTRRRRRRHAVAAAATFKPSTFCRLLRLAALAGGICAVASGRNGRSQERGAEGSCCRTLRPARFLETASLSLTECCLTRPAMSLLLRQIRKYATSTRLDAERSKLMPAAGHAAARCDPPLVISSLSPCFHYLCACPPIPLTPLPKRSVAGTIWSSKAIPALGRPRSLAS